jgi:hypothetical protein
VKEEGCCVQLPTEGKVAASFESFLDERLRKDIGGV